MSRIIFVTNFDPITKRATAPAEDSGFESIDDVVALYGEPLCRSKRTATYDGVFFSDYNLVAVYSPPRN